MLVVVMLCITTLGSIVCVATSRHYDVPQAMVAQICVQC